MQPIKALCSQKTGKMVGWSGPGKLPGGKGPQAGHGE